MKDFISFGSFKSGSASNAKAFDILNDVTLTTNYSVPGSVGRRSQVVFKKDEASQVESQLYFRREHFAKLAIYWHSFRFGAVVLLLSSGRCVAVGLWPSGS